MQVNSKISVITTLFNYQKYIKSCIESVMKQNYHDFEMIIVDDASQDGGADIVRGLLNNYKNLRLIKLNRNYGYSTAKNVGIKESCGDLIVMLDADDMLLPGSLEMRKNVIDNGHDLVHGYAFNLHGHKRSESELKGKWRSCSKDPLKWKYIHPQCVMLKKQIHNIIGMYDENLRCKSDREMWARICNHGFNVKYINSPVALYRIHEKQMHKSKWKLSNNKKLTSELLSLVEIRKRDTSDCIKLNDYISEDKIMSKEKYNNSDAILIAKKDPSILYDEEFFSKRDSKLHEWNFSMGKYAAEKLGIKSMIDWGCGIGSFLSGAKDGGVENLTGIEIGYENAKSFLVENVAHTIRYGNAAVEANFGKYDCAVSIEVAEHLLPEDADTFVRNVCNSSERMIIMTAAKPNQVGMYHFNCQPSEYWIEKICKNGFTFRKDLVEKISNGWKKRCPGLPPYLTKNLMIFKVSDKCGIVNTYKKKVDKSVACESLISFSFDLADNESSGKHKFFQRMREELSVRGYKIKRHNEKSDVHFYINNKNKFSTVNIKRLDGVYFDGSSFTASRNRSIICTMNSADGIIYQSDYCRDMGCKVLGYDWRKKPSASIYNGCSLSEFNVSPIDIGIPYFLALCKWRRHKRLKESIDGFLESKLKAKLVVAGPPDYLVNHPDVIYVGDLNRKDLARYIKGSIATVHLAWIDWCPNSVIESLVAGKQVIHTNSGGTKEIVKSRGYMVNDHVWQGEIASTKNPPELDTHKVAEAMKNSMINPIENFDVSDLLIEKTVNSYIEFGRKILKAKS